MQSLRVRLETVTPLFLAGADGETPELRPASFRGTLRFWLRALLGAYVGDDFETLQREESRVFGSTDGSSPVVVRIIAREGTIKQGNRQVLPHSTQKKFTLPSFTEDSRFSLILSSRPGQQLPDEALAALLLMLNLGGVGKRSRRGFGSLQAVKVEPQELTLPTGVKDLFEEQPGNGKALALHLTSALRKAQSLVTTSGGSPYAADALPDYPVLSEDHALILVCRHAFAHSKRSYDQAMKDFWRKVLRVLPFRDADEFGYAKQRRGKQIRRASPLILHLWRSGTGYHLVLTAFKARLSTWERGNWSLVEQLLDECRKRWQGEYVFGKGGW
jgi:CRISPR type III-B/RAMP module RAMP protein Cmr1